MSNVHQGLYLGQYDRTEELNERLMDRNIPSALLKPNYDPRPMGTKRVRFPTNQPPMCEGGERYYLEYEPEKVFYGGDSKAPVDGFMRNLSKETDLRNQTRVLQRNDPLSTYIPSSASDLYNTTVPISMTEAPQPHPELFRRTEVRTNRLPPIQFSGGFMNQTRQQLRDLM